MDEGSLFLKQQCCIFEIVVIQVDLFSVNLCISSDSGFCFSHFLEAQGGEGHPHGAQNLLNAHPFLALVNSRSLINLII